MSLGRIALLVLQSKKGRKLVLAAVVGVVVLIVGLVMFMTTAAASMFSFCQDAAEQISTENVSSSATYSSSEPSEAALADIPGNYLDAYQEAGEEYGMDWAFLAAVGKQESNHGQDIAGCATSEDGARGPMQFIPSTWSSEGVDGNGDGEKDPCNVEDAVHTAASYLQSLGAPQDYHGALCSYYGACGDGNANYADEVMAQTEEYRKAAGESGGSGEDSSGSGGGGSGSSPAFISPLISPAHAREGGGGSERQPAVATPLDKQSMGDYENDWGNERPGFTGSGGSHEGTDIFAEKGTLIYSITDGRVVENTQSGEGQYSEVGGYNVQVEASEDAGPIKEGDRILYAHMQEPPSVNTGDEVSAADEIGKVGATGYGPEVTRDEFDPHLHVGWYEFSGDRAESPTGAMNPYPMLEWAEENAGSSANNNEGGSGSNSSGSVPVAEGSSSGSGGSAGEMPEYCNPFSAAGLIKVVGDGISSLGSGGGEGDIGGGPQEGQDLVEAAMKYKGAPYVIGGLSPAECNENSIDCDCLIYLASKDINLPGTENLNGDPQQYRELGEPVEGPPEAGDIIVYEQAGILASVPGGHVAIATGNGKEIVHAVPGGTRVDADYDTQGPVTDIRRIV